MGSEWILLCNKQIRISSHLDSRRNVCWQHSRRVFSKVPEPRCFTNRPEPLAATGTNALRFSAAGTIPASPKPWLVSPLFPERREKEDLQSEPDTPSCRALHHLLFNENSCVFFTKSSFMTSLATIQMLELFFVNLLLIYASGNDWKCFMYVV